MTARVLSLVLSLLGATAALTGCVAYSGTTGEYSVGGTVSGLTTNSGVLLTDAAGSGVFVSGNGRFTIENAFADGAAYDLAVASDPGTPAVRCTVNRGQGVIAGADVENVTVECAQRAFTLGGTVSGLSAVGLILESRGAAIAVSKDGSFVFPGKITTGSSYSVTIAQNPDGESCVLTNAAGTVESTDVSVKVVCSPVVRSDDDGASEATEEEPADP